MSIEWVPSTPTTMAVPVAPLPRTVVTRPKGAYVRTVKPAFDFCAAAVGVLLAAAPMMIIAGLVALTMGRPVLFRQQRIGLDGEPFEVLKFRTMRPDRRGQRLDVIHDRRRTHKSDADPRHTKVGRFLRRTSLDELPQLFNVLRGEMSLVGPRPAPPREVEGYDVWHRRRLSMKPGITGLWQVTARSIDDFDNRAQLDLTYIDRWSLWLDLKILARTIPAALEGR